MHEKVLSILDANYQQWIVSLKKRYRQSQLKAAVKVNEELISFYWSLGRDIAMMKPEEKWGQGFYDTLSRDLRQSLPDAKGFSIRNLQCMRQFYELFPLLSIPQQAVAQTESGIAPQLAAQIVSIPWGHICLIMNRCGKGQRKALFYVNQTVLNNWSRASLLNFIQSDLYARQGKAITNIDRTLPEEGSDLARYALELSSQPLGVSSYELSNLIPEKFQGDLPTIEEIENELNKK